MLEWEEDGIREEELFVYCVGILFCSLALKLKCGDRVQD